MDDTLCMASLTKPSEFKRCQTMPSNFNSTGRLWKKCFMLSIYDILKQYGTDFSTDLQTMIDTKGDRLKTKVSIQNNRKL